MGFCCWRYLTTLIHLKFDIWSIWNWILLLGNRKRQLTQSSVSVSNLIWTSGKAESFWENRCLWTVNKVKQSTLIASLACLPRHTKTFPWGSFANQLQVERRRNSGKGNLLFFTGLQTSSLPSCLLVWLILGPCCPKAHQFLNSNDQRPDPHRPRS